MNAGKRPKGHSLSPFARAVAERRKAQGLTQEELAARVGLTSVAISHLENDKSQGSQATRQAIADALGCTVADLFAAPSTKTPTQTAMAEAIVSLQRELDETKADVRAALGGCDLDSLTQEQRELLFEVALIDDRHFLESLINTLRLRRREHETKTREVTPARRLKGK